MQGDDNFKILILTQLNLVKLIASLRIWVSRTLIIDLLDSTDRQQLIKLPMLPVLDKGLQQTKFNTLINIKPWSSLIKQDKIKINVNLDIHSTRSQHVIITMKYAEVTHVPDNITKKIPQFILSQYFGESWLLKIGKTGPELSTIGLDPDNFISQLNLNISSVNHGTW